MALSNAERRAIEALRQERYFEGQLGRTVEAIVHYVGGSDTRPEWFSAYLEMSASGLDYTHEDIYPAEVSTLDRAEDSVFALFGRAETDIPTNTHGAAKVLLTWLLCGLSAKAGEVASRCDVTTRYANKLRDEWGDEIRALTQDAACIGLSGEDLYHACVHGFPARLVERLRELRQARGSSGGMLRKEFERFVKQKWAEHKQRANGRFESEWPPSWFVKSLTSGTGG